MINWINGFKAGNKKEKYTLNFRLGKFTILEIRLCLCSNSVHVDRGVTCSCPRFRFMLFNLGFEI